MQKLYSILALLAIAMTYSLQAFAQANTSEKAAGTNKSFSEYVHDNENTAQERKEQNSQETQQENTTNKTWINNLVEKVSSKTPDLPQNSEQIQIQKRSNASVFDISGIMLRMDISQVMEAMKKRSYKKTAEHLEIPNFIRWRFEEQCRNEGVVGFERIASCVVIMAKKNNYQYIQQISFSNFHTKENIEVFLTSNFTGNKVYRIIYETAAANIKGSGPKADYLRNLKIFDFWKKINQKYGIPDNKEQVTWGLGENKPSLHAETGKLELVDPMLLELDYTRMSREDQKFMNTAVYTF